MSKGAHSSAPLASDEAYLDNQPYSDDELDEEDEDEEDSGINVFSVVASFLMSLYLLLLLLVVVAYVGFFWKPGFVSVFDDQYYQYTLDYINEQAKYYTMPTGYDVSVIDGVFTLPEVKEDVMGYVDAAFEGATYQPDETGERERIVSNVASLYERDGKEFTDEDRSYADTYADELMTIYRKAAEMPGLSALAKVRNMLVKVVFVVMLVLAALCVIAVIVLAKSDRNGISYVAYATGGACLLSFVAPAALYLSGAYKGLNLSPRFFYHFGVSLIEHLIRLCLMGSGIYLVITILLVVIALRRRKRLA